MDMYNYIPEKHLENNNLSDYSIRQESPIYLQY